MLVILILSGVEWGRIPAFCFCSCFCRCLSSAYIDSENALGRPKNIHRDRYGCRCSCLFSQRPRNRHFDRRCSCFCEHRSGETRFSPYRVPAQEPPLPLSLPPTPYSLPTVFLVKPPNTVSIS